MKKHPVLGAAWLLTRAVGVLMLANQIPYWTGFGRVNGDVQLYQSWSTQLLHGAVPYRDFYPVYPPGVLPLVALPHSSINMFVAEFIGLVLLADLLCLIMLLRVGATRLPAAVWIVGLPLVGPVVWGRFDIFVALGVIAAFVALQRRRYVLAGGALAYAGLIKLWPFLLVLLLLPVLGRRAGPRLVAGAMAVLGLAMVPLYATGAGFGLRFPLTLEAHRGIEMESLPAVPLYIARSLGAPWHIDLRYGSLDLAMQGGGVVKEAATLLLLAVLLWLAVYVWRRRTSIGCQHILLCLVVLLITFSRVLSPQYLAWVVAAVALYIDQARDPRRLLAWTALALIATQMLFPFKFPSVVDGTAPGLLMVVVHAAVIAVLAVIAVADVMRTSARPAEIPALAFTPSTLALSAPPS